MTFWNEIFERVENINVLDYPDAPGDPSPAEDDETVVGEATDIIKKLYVARYMLVEELENPEIFPDEDQLKETLGQMVVNDAKEYIEEMRKKQSRVKKLVDVLTELLWSTVKDEYGIWGELIGIRDGWKIVTFESVVVSFGMPNIADIFDTD